VNRLALELHRRGQLVPARLPLGVEDLELLDLLDPRHGFVGRVDAALDLRQHCLLPVLLGEGRRHVGVERDEADVERLAVADGDGLADQRARRLDPWPRCWRATCSCRPHDDQLLLAVDDLEVAVVVELAHVTGV
jgi:hypothetical protein